MGHISHFEKKIGSFQKWSGTNFDIETLNNYHPNYHHGIIKFLRLKLLALEVLEVELTSPALPFLSIDANTRPRLNTVKNLKDTANAVFMEGAMNFVMTIE